MRQDQRHKRIDDLKTSVVYSQLECSKMQVSICKLLKTRRCVRQAILLKREIDVKNAEGERRQEFLATHPEEGESVLYPLYR